MSTVKISSSVAELVSFIKDKTIANLLELKNSGGLLIDDAEFHKLVAIIDQSSSQGLSLGYSNVESAVIEHMSEAGESRPARKVSGWNPPS
tara:strand:+ start:364 stop:636 length:273 start_codon:yes stop_codon:yes gene_type:complete